MTRWAICGTGGITTKFMRAIQEFDDACIVACASSTIERACEFGNLHGLVPYTYQDLYKAKDIDAVYVCTNNHLHFDNVMGLIGSGIPVLCEKPFSLDVQQARQMTELASQKGVLLMEAMWTAFLPCTQAVIQLAKEQGIKSTKGYFVIPHIGNTAHRIHKYEYGGGVLLDIGSYLVSYTYGLLGYPKNIKASSVFSQSGIDQHTQMQLQYDNGVSCVLECLLSQNRECYYVIETDKGTIRIDSFNGATKFVHTDKNGNTHTQTFEPDTNGFVYQIRHFMQLLNQNKTQSDIMPHSRTVAVMQILTDCKNQ